MGVIVIAARIEALVLKPILGKYKTVCVVSAATKAALITQLSRSNWRHIVIASATKSAQAAKAMAGMLNPVKNRPSAADTVTACAVAN